MIINFRNVNSLQAMDSIVHELARFLDGWGEFDYILIDTSRKEIKITIEPKEEAKLLN